MTRIPRRALMLGSVSAVALTACSTPISATLLNDGQLIVAGLQVLAGTPLVPAADAALIALALKAVSTGVTDLQAGSTTAADFVKVATDEVNTISGPLLTDLHANATITAGVNALKAILPVIAEDVAPTSDAPSTAALVPGAGRRPLVAFVAAHGGGK